MERFRNIVGAMLAATMIFVGGCAGYFAQVGVGDTGQVQGDITCTVGEDGAYTATWTTRVVAGSSRDAWIDTSGTAVDTGDTVAFAEQAGSRFTLKRVGNTLDGIRKDPVSGRTIAVRLERVSPGE